MPYFTKTALKNRSIFKLAILAAFSLLCISFPAVSQTKQTIQNTIIPKPIELKFNTEVFKISAATIITYSPGCKELASFINEAVTLTTGYPLALNKETASNNIAVIIDSNLVKEKEGYQLRVVKNSITVTGHDKAGLFYGIQSLIQLFKVNDKQLSVPGVTIYDHPRFAYRGLHLDVSRNMYPITFIKKYINLLAFYKLNTFHWHLTDDQGWRIEIKKYSKLQTIAAYRDETMIG
ncbi:MAG: beta-hexosaminidase, partial [Daejeonella sp.]|nr:beta-hexosaminidase [Daejeonella sp.]